MTGSRPVPDGRAPATSTSTGGRRPSVADPRAPGPQPCDSQPSDPTRPARRQGRHTRRALGADAVPVTVFTARHLLVPTSGADPAHGIKVSAAQVGLLRSSATPDRTASFDASEVYAAASRARRSARDTVARLTGCADRIRLAALTVAPDAGATVQMAEGADTIAEATALRLRAIERADRRLVETLEALDAAKLVVGNADRELQRFHPHGGTLVVTLPTRKRALDRVNKATSAATLSYHVADNATYSLVKEMIIGERAARAVDYLVAYLLDHGMPAEIAPPVFLRFVRAALPHNQQLDWWRELCSLFAECHPHERRAQVTSQGLNALRTIWTAWEIKRRATVPRPEKERSWTRSR